MATPDLNQLQQILQNAEKNDAQLTALKKAFNKIALAMDEFAELLSDDYQPVKRERKPREVKEGARKAGRPRKNANAEA
ncbi:hypothetical protein [Hymenobacter sublimis]|uniref:Uncharacterized protein n=1 Tax=Hymenobacter sublimis TaxID=2933777 RepID=A0ABY4JCK5_9BACT|nr:hypothetical protein [Hymenobacter sublimis]UPL50541.1 hypothetical protein MWH26_06440 [Hymenobacter sublimis]